MTKSGLPNSARKFIRTEKARIRATVLDTKKQKEIIQELYNKFTANKTDDKTSADNQKAKNDLNLKPEPKNQTEKDKKLKVNLKNNNEKTNHKTQREKL